jgi:hypothetical protein
MLSPYASGWDSVIDLLFPANFLFQARKLSIDGLATASGAGRNFSHAGGSTHRAYFSEDICP